jgi:DNA-binding transcriptional ArsR family regulator
MPREAGSRVPRLAESLSVRPAGAPTGATSVERSRHGSAARGAPADATFRARTGAGRLPRVEISAPPSEALPPTERTPLGIEPTREELRISARILLHIARQPRVPPGETALESLTQAGMATALGASQPAVSNALKRLVDGGALRVERSHVRGLRQRLKVYQLTALGENLVRHIRSTMAG